MTEQRITHTFFKCKLNCVQIYSIVLKPVSTYYNPALFSSPAQCLKTETSSTLSCDRVCRRRSCSQFSKWATRSWASRGMVRMLITPVHFLLSYFFKTNIHSMSNFVTDKHELTSK